MQIHLEIIKVFSIKDEFDFQYLKPYEDVCDYFFLTPKANSLEATVYYLIGMF